MAVSVARHSLSTTRGSGWWSCGEGTQTRPANGPWREDTVTQAWSTTKGVSAIAAAKLVEQGHLDYKKLVKDYWPEFAQNGKANVTVEMLLSHQAGLATMGGASVSLEEYKNDWKKVEKIMAAAAPEYPPGRSVGYHALTFGMYVDALIRRADPKHRNLTQFFQDEIAKPFGIDFFIGLPREQAWRAARGHLITSVEFFSLLLDTDHRYLIWNMLTSSDELFTKSGKAISGFDMDTSNDLTKLDVGVGSTMGFGAAGPLAKLYDYLANGGTIGKKQLLPKKIVDLFSTPLTASLPSAHGKSLPEITFSQGFMVLPQKDSVLVGHSGYGGQQAYADLHYKVGIAYVTNFHSPRMISPPDNYLELAKVFYECFEKQRAKANTSS
ncbi:hypothetical protein BaRGS_00033393 [Batillaria attramentaria]|uniref:Beta-lactamase-related domain-containing protein n=1 Tax=Batillaria attramentaria TaxID=370345 RepID=A0ABD0JL19_9CAEN